MQVIGIDVSKKTLDVCVLFNEKVRRKVFGNDEVGFKDLISWISNKDSHICMESTGCYSQGIAEFLYDLGYKVSIVNPLQIKAFRTSKLVRQKTDKSDAEVIARFCLQNNPSLWHPKSCESKELREINSRINSLKEELGRLTNFLEKKHNNDVVRDSIYEEIDFIKRSIQRLEIEANKIIESNDRLKKQYNLLSNIKGIGPKTALTILADMPDVSNFKTAKQYACFVGVAPSHFQSGTSINRKAHISRLGSRKIRKTLYMSAIVVKNHNEYFRNWVDKLKNRGKQPKVIIVAVMRKLLHIVYGILKTNQNFDEKLAFAT